MQQFEEYDNKNQKIAVICTKTLANHTETFK